METAEAQPTPLSETRRLTGVFHEPGSVFADIARNGRWWIPLLIIVILSSLFITVMVNRMGYDLIVQKIVESNPRMQEMPADQREKAIEIQRKTMPYVMRVLPVVAIFVVTFISAAALLFVLNFMFDAKLKYKEVLNIDCYASLPPAVVSSIVGIVVMYLKPAEDIDFQNPLAFNLGAFLAPNPKWLQSLGTSIDLFSFWTIALLAVGFTAACGARKMPFSRSLTAILIPWAFYVLGKTAIAALFG